MIKNNHHTHRTRARLLPSLWSLLLCVLILLMSIMSGSMNQEDVVLSAIGQSQKKHCVTPHHYLNEESVVFMAKI